LFIDGTSVGDKEEQERYREREYQDVIGVLEK